MVNPEQSRDDKILEAISRQHSDIKVIAEQNNTIIKKLEEHDTPFNRIESAVLDNSKDINGIKTNLDTAVTNHENRLRTLETKVGI